MATRKTETGFEFVIGNQERSALCQILANSEAPTEISRRIVGGLNRNGYITTETYPFARLITLGGRPFLDECFGIRAYLTDLGHAAVA